MAAFEGPAKSFNFAILDDFDDLGPVSPSCSTVSIVLSQGKESVLSEVSGNQRQDVASTPDLLARRLEQLHIQTPAKLDWTPVNKTRGLKPRPQIGSSTFDRAPETTTSALESSPEAAKYNPLAEKFNKLDYPDWMQLAKHQRGQFEWVFSLPASSDPGEQTTTCKEGSAPGSGSKKPTKKVRFGCTLVRADGESELVRRNRAQSANTFTLLATPIEEPVESDDKTSTEPMESLVEKTVKTATPSISEAEEVKSLYGVIEETKSLDGFVGQNTHSPVAERSAPAVGGGIEDKNQARSPVSEYGDGLEADTDRFRRTSDSPPSSKKDGIVDQSLCFPASPSSLSSRIEDSVEALDEFEEQLEAISAATQLDRVLPPRATERATLPSLVVAGSPSPRRALPTRTKQQEAKTASGSTRGKFAERKVPARHSMATAPARANERDLPKVTGLPRRLPVSKPASLNPPKPVTRAAKPPTVSTFELPGEAVARRLKEKREARLSQSMSMPTSAAQAYRAGSASPAKAKAAGKPPTKPPSFELPGEAISRRKREEREAKLKAQEEEERKKREFKARPVRASITSGSLSYRETAASRARQSVIRGGGAFETTPTTPPAAKRYSMAATIHGRPSLGRPALNLGTAPQASSASKAGTGTGTFGGRRTFAVPEKEAAARAASSPTGSVSAEDKQAQKERGRAIYESENGAAFERQREMAGKTAAWVAAKEEAAERSREISRRWKEEQRVKRLGTRVRMSLSPSPYYG